MITDDHINTGDAEKTDPVGSHSGGRRGWEHMRKGLKQNKGELDEGLCGDQITKIEVVFQNRYSVRTYVPRVRNTTTATLCLQPLGAANRSARGIKKRPEEGQQITAPPTRQADPVLTR
jgi:hypothetical protein